MISDLSAKLFKRYHSDKHFSVFTYKMATKINWHRYGTKLRHCHRAMGHYFPVSQNGNLVVLALLQFTD